MWLFQNWILAISETWQNLINVFTVITHREVVQHKASFQKLFLIQISYLFLVVLFWNVLVEFRAFEGSTCMFVFDFLLVDKNWTVYIIRNLPVQKKQNFWSWFTKKTFGLWLATQTCQSMHIFFLFFCKKLTYIVETIIIGTTIY